MANGHARPGAGRPTNGHGGARPGAGRPLGRRNLRPSGTIIAAERAEQGLVPVRFEGGDSLAFLRATMEGTIWPTREQIYAAKSVLPIEHSPAVTFDGRTIDEIKAESVHEYVERQKRMADEHREDLINEVGRMRKAMIEDCDTRLRGWMAAGLVSDDFAPQIRSLYAKVDQGDEPFDPAGR